MEEYHNLSLRYDSPPIWPSMKFECTNLLNFAGKLFIKEAQIKTNSLQSLIFKMNILIAIIHEN